MRLIVRVSMALVALAAAALSYQSLARLGELCGYGSLSWLYPLVVDLGAAASCAAWLHTRSRQALGMTWSLLTVSVVLNGTTHYLESTGTAPSWLLVVAVAAVPPVVLGLCVHLAVGLGSDGVRCPPDGLTARGHSAAPERDAEPLDDPSEGDGTPPDWWAGAPFAGAESGRAAELIAAGAGRRRLASELGISEHEARRLLAERNGVAR